MFGHDDNQQPIQDNGGVLQAEMPGSLPDTNQMISSHPNSSITPSMSEPPQASPIPGSPIASNIIVDVSAPGPSTNSNDELLDLKQQVLQHLSPLVSHLDQTPEEKFRTTMMMIQASDDQTLIKTAFEAAQQITDDKARAQALLDIINEINYFTQHQTNG